MSGDLNPNDAGVPAPAPSSDGRRSRPLPPPAFPPGAKRVSAPKVQPASDDLSGAFILPDDPIPQRPVGVPDDAFISPDEPIHRKPVGAPDDAFISPDEPIRQRAPHSPTLTGEAIDPDEVVVTGIGDDAHMEPDELAAGFDPHVLEVVDEVSKLAEALKRRGEAGLRTTPETTRFGATLRSYCVGYLAGRRAADEEG